MLRQCMLFIWYEGTGQMFSWFKERVKGHNFAWNREMLNCNRDKTSFSPAGKKSVNSPLDKTVDTNFPLKHARISQMLVFVFLHPINGAWSLSYYWCSLWLVCWVYSPQLRPYSLSPNDLCNCYCQIHYSISDSKRVNF